MPGFSIFFARPNKIDYLYNSIKTHSLWKADMKIFRLVIMAVVLVGWAAVCVFSIAKVLLQNNQYYEKSFYCRAGLCAGMH